MRFTKMHGTGNDYIYVNCFEETLPQDLSKLAREISDRHFGVGSDGLVLIAPSEQADFLMRIFNADGSEAEMCGNAARCVGRYVYERGLTQKTEVTLETANCVRTLQLNVQNNKVVSVRVDMGVPVFAPEQIPVDLPGEAVISYPLQAGDRTVPVTCVSVGNPHCVLFVEDDPNQIDLPKIGPVFEHHPAFPHRINTEFIRVLDREHLQMRVWERGSGETLACGTGACAALAAAVANKLCERKVTISLRGGDLQLMWQEDGHIFQEGPAVFVCDGVWLNN